MSKSNAPFTEAVIWVGHDDPEVRAILVEYIEDALDEAQHMQKPVLDRVDFHVVDTPLRGPSLMDVMHELNPEFWGKDRPRSNVELALENQNLEAMNSILTDNARRKEDRLDLCRHVIKSDRSVQAKHEVLKFVLDKNHYCPGNAADMQIAIEERLWPDKQLP